MTRIALLIEDDEEQVPRITSVLKAAGFSVTAFSHGQEASDLASAVSALVDLIVLDRRLPWTPEDEPIDDVGDRLLVQLLDEFGDVPMIVFSGHTGIPHAQFATRDKGVLPVGRTGENLDRVYLFEKVQTLEFQEYVERVAACVDALDNIDVNGLLGSGDQAQLDRRLLRRVASHYGASSIRVQALTGGLTQAPVWSCYMTDSSGGLLATVVVKRVLRDALPQPGGLQDILPAANVAAPVAVIWGLSGGQRGQVLQLASGDATPLMKWIEAEPVRAASQVEQLRLVTQPAAEGPQVAVTLAELVAPLISWGNLEERLHEYGLTVPRAELLVTTRMVTQHGDLHAGNVLVVQERPVLIDWDSQERASALLDPLTLLLSTLFHLDSPLRHSSWPSVDQCSAFPEEAFLTDCPALPWLLACREWVRERTCGQREFWGLVLAFAARQLKYDDVLEDAMLRARAVALATLAAEHLTAG